MKSLFDPNVEYRGLKSVSKLFDVIISIREKLDKLPENSFTDSIIKSINNGTVLIAEHYRDPSLPDAGNSFVEDYENANCLLAFIESPIFSELVKASINLENAQKSVYLASIEAHGTSDKFFSIVLFQKKINNFLHEMSSLSEAAIIYYVDNVKCKIILNPKGAEVYVDRNDNNVQKFSKEYSINNILEVANSVLREFDKFERENEARNQSNDVFKSAYKDGEMRRSWFKDFDYEILSILLSYFVLKKTELNRIGNVIDRYNMFCENRQNIYRLIAQYTEGDDSILKEIRSIIEYYYFNNPVEYYDNYLYCCELLNIAPESVQDIRSFEALKKTTDKLSEEVPVHSRPSKSKLSTDEHKGQLYELRKVEKEFEEVKKMVAAVREVQAERLADIYRNIDD